MVSFYPRNRKIRRPNPFVVAVFMAYFVNFFAFAIISGIIGGDALSGHAAGGHYYLAEHGKLTEVSQGVFIYSQWHALLTFGSILVLIPIVIWFRIFKPQDADPIKT